MGVTMTTRYTGQAKGFCHWLKRVRLIYVVTGLCFMVIFVPFIIHGYISVLAAAEDDDFDSHRSRSKLDHPDELTSVKVSDLKFRVEELKRIKASVNNELRELESKRQKLHSEISGYNIHLEQLKKEYEQSHVELQQLTATIENRKEEFAELIQRSTPEITAPKQILPSLADEVYIPPPKSSRACRMHTCFDYSRCSMTSQFPVYFYHPLDYLLSTAQLDAWVQEAVLKLMKNNLYITADPHIACIYIVVMGELDRVNASVLEDRLHNLPFWRGDGRNHILLNLARSSANRDMFERVDTGRAMIAQSTFSSLQFRPGFDIILPPSLGGMDGDVWHTLSPISPARRLHLLSFQGEYLILYDLKKSAPLTKLSQPPVDSTRHFSNHSDVKSLKFHSNNPQFVPNGKVESKDAGRPDAGVHHLVQDDLWEDKDNEEPAGADEDAWYRDLSQNEDIQRETEKKLSKNEKGGLPNDKKSDFDMNSFGRTLKSAKDVHEDIAVSETPELVALERSIVDTLKRMQNLFQEGAFQFEFSCGGERTASLNAEWALCNPVQKRHDVLRKSTFALILAPTNYSIISSTVTQMRLYEAFNHGAIPVILGDYFQLPFMETIHWHKSAIILPKARITEIHFYLQSISDGDILEMRRQGRHLWETHFGSAERIISTLLATVRMRLNIPALPVVDTVSKSVFNATFQPLVEEVMDPPPDAEEVLGPMESPMPSFKFRRNFTSTMNYLSDYHDPFHLYPFTPFEPVLPAEAKFLGSSLGFRPIGKGAGGAGKEFHMALGGNHPREQFTIVMLTYERDAVLITALHRLKSLPHLNKVLVVWNNPEPPAEDLKWPDIGVPIHVLRTAKNSLNNRFLPYDLIETEAILSMDDDAHLRHDEIIFGFRVWRESRDRLVGFPGRFHAWDSSAQTWQYNSNYSCELSMVLTGAAFFHKYYAYLYSYIMPQAIRDKVDEYINCEDLAMNFLVSHVTRMPPIKVTSRWTFRCPGCPQALSEDDSHFQERHKCLNFFTSIYGYMPLLSTQFRVDSVLFKTRIPHDKQKCFKFI